MDMTIDRLGVISFINMDKVHLYMPSQSVKYVLLVDRHKCYYPLICDSMSLCICCDFMCLCIQRQVTKALSISFKQSLDLHYKIFVHRSSCTQRMLSYPLLCCVCPPLSWYFFQIPSASQHPLGPQTSVSQQAQQAPLIKHHLGAAVALATPTINTY